jgi:hypothetical protein
VFLIRIYFAYSLSCPTVSRLFFRFYSVIKNSCETLLDVMHLSFHSVFRPIDVMHLSFHSVFRPIINFFGLNAVIFPN